MTAKDGWMEKRSKGETRPSLDVHFLIRSIVKEIVNDSHKASSAERNEAMNGLQGIKFIGRAQGLHLQARLAIKNESMEHELCTVVLSLVSRMLCDNMKQ